MKGKYLSEVININDLGYGCINLINAPCGSGKTTFALNKLVKLTEDTNDGWSKNMLYLIDTKNGKEQLLRNGTEYINSLGDAYWKIDNITVMTYAGYATLCKKAPEKDIWKSDAVIVLDELHNCIKYSKWDKNDIHKTALDLLTARIQQYDNIVIALSATPKVIIDYFENFTDSDSGYVRIIEPLDEVRHYEDAHTEKYYNLKQILNKIEAGSKGIIYVPHISEINKYQEYLTNKGIRAASFWSVNNTDHPMTQEQISLREYVINNQKIPNNVDVLLINKSCETSINIKSHIDFMIIHSSEEDTQIQARGRYRNDLERLYLYDEDVINEIIIIPDKWINKKLYKSDIVTMIEELNLRDDTRHLIKKPTLLKWLKIDGLYTVSEKKIKGGKRYIIIS